MRERETSAVGEGGDVCIQEGGLHAKKETEICGGEEWGCVRMEERQRSVMKRQARRRIDRKRLLRQKQSSIS